MKGTYVLNATYGLIAFAGVAALWLTTDAITITKAVAREEKLEEICSQESATPQSYKIRTQNIDQIFEDHGGYRLLSRDKDGKVIENNYGLGLRPRPLVPDTVQREFKNLTPKTQEGLTVYRDLEKGAQPFAKILEYTVAGCVYFNLAHGDENLEGTLIPHYYVEVHLPENQGIAAGIDSWAEGKERRSGPIQEIK